MTVHRRRIWLALAAPLVLVAAQAQDVPVTPAEGPQPAPVPTYADDRGRTAEGIISAYSPEKFIDLWDTGTEARVDEQGQVLYVVKSKLVPRSRADMRARAEASWYDPHMFDPHGTYFPTRRVLRRVPVRDGNMPSAGSPTTRPPASSSMPRSAPAPMPRRSNTGADRRSER